MDRHGGAPRRNTLQCRHADGGRTVCVFIQENKELFMRFLVKVSLPVEKFNAAVRDGSASKKMQQILGDIKPEASYFWEEDGKRGGVLVVNMEKASQIPSIAEPWFLQFDAAVSFHPCMTPEDLAAAGLEELGKKYR
jgi:hypothetical protein